jgi:DNA-binding protein H-NS
MQKDLEKQPVDALLKLRDEVNAVLEKKVGELQSQLSLLGRGIRVPGTERRSELLGRKVAPKYHDRQGNTWAGRGMYPRWLQEKLKKGAKLKDFEIGAKRTSVKQVTRRPRKSRIEMESAPEAAE